MKQRSIILILLLTLAGVFAGCATNWPSRLTESSVLLDTVEFSKGIDLTQDKLNFLARLAEDARPAALELLRQYLYDADPKMQAHALALLDDRGDVSTSIERFLLRHPEFCDDSEESRLKADAFVDDIKDLDALAAAVSHTKVKVYRPEFPYLGFGRAGERLGSPIQEDERFFSFKTSAGMAGMIFDDDNQAPVADQRGWSALSTEMQRILGPMHEQRQGVWCRYFPRFASPPACGDGRYFLGDGEGNLLCGEMNDGRTQWRVPFPIPPYAKITVRDGQVSVAFESDLKNLLVARFDAASGRLLAIAVVPQLSPEHDHCAIAGKLFHVERSGQGTDIVCTFGGKTLWRRHTDCVGLRVFSSARRLFVLGEWEYRMFSLASFDPSSGDCLWAVPIRPADGLRLEAMDGANLWLLDDESLLLCVDQATGQRRVRTRAVSQWHSLPVTALGLDRRTDRLLLDPSNGFIYSLPREPFLAQSVPLSPRNAKDTLPFEVAFRLSVVVSKSSVSVEPQNSDPNHPFFRRLTDPGYIFFREFAETFDSDRFQVVPLEGWRGRWEEFSRALVTKAGQAGFDVHELQGCLDVVWRENGRNRTGTKVAIVPTSAYQIDFKGEPAWVIVCRWEYEYEHPLPGIKLSHARVWAISAKTREVLTHYTCM